MQIILIFFSAQPTLANSDTRLLQNSKLFHMVSFEKVKQILNDYFQYFFMAFMLTTVSIMVVVVLIVNSAIPQEPLPTSGSANRLTLTDIAGVRSSKDVSEKFRPTTLEQLNDKSVVVAVAQGLGSTVKQALPDAQVKEVPVDTLLTVAREGLVHAAFARRTVIDNLAERCGDQCTRLSLH